MLVGNRTHLVTSRENVRLSRFARRSLERVRVGRLTHPSGELPMKNGVGIYGPRNQAMSGSVKPKIIEGHERLQTLFSPSQQGAAAAK